MIDPRPIVDYALASGPRMDPPRDAHSRCVHEMLAGQCSICRGLPDVPLREEHDPPRRRRRQVTVDRHGVECGGCDLPLPIGDGAVWTPGGLVCIDCDEADL